MAERFIEYEHDGVVLEGFIAWDESLTDPQPGVLVSHAWAGRGEFECNKARRLAQLGYVGFALDMYGKNVHGSSPDENAGLMQPFIDNRQMLQARQQLALATLRGQPEVDAQRTAAIGFCFGGLCVLDLARTGSDIQAVVSLHGLFGAPGNTAGTPIKARVLALHGHDDPMVPVDAVNELKQELTTAGADWQLHVFGQTMHAFTNPAANDPELGTVFNAAAERRSWVIVEDFLNEILR